MPIKTFLNAPNNRPVKVWAERSEAMLNELLDWWELRQARKAAKRYNLDFERKCVFNHQLRSLGYPEHGKICKVPMQSGKVGLYKAEITHFWPGNEQKDWRFEFQGYAPNTEIEVTYPCQSRLF